MDWLLFALVFVAAIYLSLCALVIWHNWRSRSRYYDPWKHTRSKRREGEK